MIGWNKQKVGNMGRVQGGRQRSPHLTEGKLCAYLRVANVFDGYIDVSDVNKMPFTEVEYERYLLKPGDLLLNEGQSLELVGRSAEYVGQPENCCFQNTLIRFQAGPCCDKDFALQLFRWCQKSGIFALIATKTNSIAHLGSTRFAELELPFPPLPEQIQIAAILSTWDDSLSILARLIDIKRQQKRALAEQLLTGKRRLKGFEGEWERISIADIAQEFSERGNDRSLTVLSCTKHHGLVRSLEYFGKRIFSEDISSYKLVRRGMFAYATNHLDEGSIGLQEIEDAAVISPMYTVFQTSDCVNIQFFYALLKTEFSKSIFVSQNSASVDRRGSVRWAVFSKIRYLLPSFPEQEAIAAVLSALDTEIDLLTRQQAKVQEQKRGLMDLLLTGKVRVKVPETEQV